MNLDGFTVEAASGNPRPAFPTPPVGSPSTRFIAETRAVAADQSIKGWITIDGTDGFLPVAVVYADAAEILRVRFQGDWLWHSEPPPAVPMPRARCKIGDVDRLR